MTTNIASTNMTTDASEMLAAALEQMDGIIADFVEKDLANEESKPRPETTPSPSPSPEPSDKPQEETPKVNLSEPLVENNNNTSSAGVPGSKTEFFNGVIEPRSPQYTAEPSNEVLTLLDGAKSLLETMEENDQDTVMSQLPEGTRNYLTQWLRPNNSETKTTNGHAYPSDGYEEKIQKLENDKESLILQVSVLTDQVEAQGEKIRELENGMESQKDQQADTEEMLQQEILARSSLETQKLDLMAEVSNLKIQMASLDKERADLEDKNQTAQSLLNEIAELKNKLDASEEKCAEFEQKNKQTQAIMAKLASLKVKISSLQFERHEVEKKYKQAQMEVATLQSTLNERDSEVEELKAEMTEIKKQQEEEREKEEEKKTDEGDSEKVKRLKKQMVEKQEEYNNLKRAVESLMQANEEKDIKIEELKSSLNRYKRVQDMVLSASSPGRKDGAPGEEVDPVVTPPTPPEQEPLEETLKETQSSSMPSLSKQPTDAPKQAEEYSTRSLPRLYKRPVVSKPPPSPPPQQRIAKKDVRYLRLFQHRGYHSLPRLRKDPTPKPAMPDPAFTSTPINTNNTGEQLSIQELGTDTSHEGQVPSTINETPQTTVDAIEADQVEKEPAMESPPKPPRLRPQARSSSLEEIKVISDSEKSPPPQSRFNTLPPKQKPPQQQEPGLITRKGRGLGSFGKGFLKMRGGNKSTSAPNLSQTEAGSDSELDGISAHRAQPIKMEGDERFGYEPKKRGNTITRFFGRLKRSASTTFNPDRDVEYEEPSPFRRGGRYRATAGPRLGWSRDLKPTTREHSDSETATAKRSPTSPTGKADWNRPFSPTRKQLRGETCDLDTPFAKWDPDQVCQWLHEQGLGMYVGNARHYVKRGETLLRSSPHDLERELGIKNYLHRKKLQLALQAIGSEDTSKMGELDHNWVTRWLDDVGLPQYKDPFNEARIDGRMLNYMTVDDLFKLNVTNVLHHLSFKRAIQVLRLQNFEPNCLRRRPTEETWQNGAEVMLWTNHRVMEWLRCVDLSEYAPNLRGSGVHGGLMVLEAKFNAETLAHLLSIPPNKTLLRRHLSTHFTQLVGAEIQRYKREHQEGPGYIPIKATDKMKPRKRSFSFTRKSRGQSHDYVCPMDCDFPVELSPGRGQPGFRGEVRAANLQHRQEPVNDDLDQEVPEIDEQAVQQIGAFSAEINTLTNMLSDDNFSPSSGASDA
ncbi:PREDICTED: liprin-beta-1-like isoform X1 [Branchiostoma belcheri]|uniref:Liprin-beta-1-like isoform X1 n=1 Tax=Branchiostoma belcheri TaxID=7741 RepID=A0A6P4Z0Z9_BRABE|nr:PREDICTED: liprin-beta-1-like isoform X1 [Branchiostoma belcheri]XP_019627638.1 PREDICTED: liprin-beta-1-like isoform X1 [Branchiostoma belcheri]XP_019627639.1 PREDICTED: liprin-beta-1-like isoform X1 [Branchiostoma belcheri]